MPSPLGEGQTVPLKNRHNQGEVRIVDIPSETIFHLTLLNNLSGWHHQTRRRITLVT